MALGKVNLVIYFLTHQCFSLLDSARLPETTVVFCFLQNASPKFLSQTFFIRDGAPSREITEAVPLAVEKQLPDFPFPPVSALQSSLFLSACMCSTNSH